MIKFIIMSLISAGVVALASLIWPKLTASPRPQVLQDIHDAVVKTQAGNRAEDILGETHDSEGGTPVNLPALVASAGANLISGIGQKTSDIISTQAAAVVLNQYRQLPSTAQEVLQQAIRETAQQLIPGLVPQAVIDALEVIEIHHPDGER